ncbi:hypothetical protein LRP88_12061 [Fusarium phalaenopsidis]
MESRLWPLRRALQGVSPVWKKTPSGLFRRDTTPAICYDDCEPDSPPGPDIATIVGPVVPSVVLLIVLTFLGFRWYKKRERIKDQEAQIEPDEEPKVEKAQLHSDYDSSNANIPIIVGSVIPSFVFLACAAFFGIWWWKRRQKQPKESKLAHVEGGSSEKPEIEYKAQLPSDCVPRPTYELEGSAPLAPGSSSSDTAVEAEMPANEVPAQEMPTDVNNTRHQPGSESSDR